MSSGTIYHRSNAVALDEVSQFNSIKMPLTEERKWHELCFCFKHYDVLITLYMKYTGRSKVWKHDPVSSCLCVYVQYIECAGIVSSLMQPEFTFRVQLDKKTLQ